MPGLGQETGKRLWKAGELARETGLTRQALHQYVVAGLLTPADMTKGGQRLFAAGAKARVKLIRELAAIGYPLKEIRDVFLRSTGETSWGKAPQRDGDTEEK